MKVADVMSRQVEYVTVHTRVEDVARLIFGRGINGVPVVSSKKRLVGFITERDILAKFYPSMQEYIEDPVHSSDFEEMEKEVDEVFGMTAEEIMSGDLTTVTAETPLLRAQSLMSVHKVGRLPVVDKRGNLVGILSKGDIFRAIVGDKLFFAENQDYNDWLSKTYYAAVDVENRLKHELPDLLKIFSQNNVKIVLDVGCGTGDHVIALAKKGFTAVGVDRSSSMIQEANKRKKVLSEEVKRRLRFFIGEAHTVLKKLDTSFDAILFMGNTISHNPYSIEELIKNVSKYASNTGLMILQITNFEKVLKVQKRLLSLSFAKLKDGIEKEYAFLEFYDLPDNKKKTIIKTFAILRSEGQRWKWAGVRNSLMVYSNKDYIKKILEKNGFLKVSFYGGSFDGREWDFLFRKPFKPLESDWLNVVAKR